MILWEFVNCASNRVLAWIFGYSELDYDPIELFFLAFYMLSIEETDLKHFFLRTLLDWFFVWRNQHFSTILDLLDFCNIRFWFVHPCILPVYLGVSLFWYQWILITYQKSIEETDASMEEIVCYYFVNSPFFEICLWNTLVKSNWNKSRDFKGLVICVLG